MTRDAPMILAYDGSPHARGAIAQAAGLLAGRHAVVLTVWLSYRHASSAARLAVSDETIQVGTERLDAAAEEAARRLSEEGASFARDSGLDAVALAKRGDAGVAAAIVRVAEEQDAAVIGIGRKSRSEVGSLVLGSVTYSVLHHTSRPVLAASGSTNGRAPASGPVMLCYDGSANSRFAIERAGSLLAPAATVVAHHWDSVADGVMRTLSNPPVTPELAALLVERESNARAEGGRIAAEGARLARQAGLNAKAVPVGDNLGAWPELVQLAERRDARAIVVGSRGRSRLRSLVLGSVSHALVQHGDRPVLVVPGPR